MDVGPRQVVFATPVNGFVVVLKTFFGVKHRLKFFPFDVKERERLNGRGFIYSSHTSDQITDMSNLVNRHGMFVFGDRKHTETVGGVLTGRNGDDTRKGLNPAGVDGLDASIMMRRAQNFPN